MICSYLNRNRNSGTIIMNCLLGLSIIIIGLIVIFALFRCKKRKKKYPVKFQEDSYYLSIAKVKITPLLQHIWWKVPGAGGQEKRWNKRPPEFAGGKNIPWCGRYFNTLNKFVTKLRVFWVFLQFGSPWRLRMVVWYKWCWKMTHIMLVQNGG